MTVAKKLNIHMIEINPAKNLKATIAALLHEIGVPAHIKGYQYLKDAIAVVAEDPTTTHFMTKELYPYVAKRHKTTSSRVERAIRHAVEVAFSRGDLDTLHTLFGNTMDMGRGKPTNSEFISLVAESVSDAFQQ